MADDWQVGDLALCVKVGRWDTYEGHGLVDPMTDPECGKAYVVEEVLPCEVVGLVLGLQGFDESFYDACRFIKVTPEAEDAFDREVNDHMAGQEVEDA